MEENLISRNVSCSNLKLYIDFKDDVKDADLAYRNLSSAFRKLVDKHAPLKTKVQRGNTAPFMNQQLQKAIYTRSRLKKS